MNTTTVDAEINEAHAELAALVNSLINNPVNQKSAQLTEGLSYDLKEDIGKRLTGLKNDLKTAREAEEDLLDEIESLKRSTTQLEIIVKKHQTENETRHQHLLSELPMAIHVGTTQIVELLHRLKNDHAQVTKEIKPALASMIDLLEKTEATQLKKAKQNADRLMWIIGGLTLNSLMIGALLLHALTVH